MVGQVVKCDHLYEIVKWFRPFRASISWACSWTSWISRCRSRTSALRAPVNSVPCENGRSLWGCVSYICVPAQTCVWRLSVHLSFSSSVCLSVCAFVFLVICLSVCLCICLSHHLSVCAFVFLVICLSVCAFVFLIICLSVCLSVFVNQFVCLSYSPTHTSDFCLVSSICSSSFFSSSTQWTCLIVACSRVLTAWPSTCTNRSSSKTEKHNY